MCTHYALWRYILSTSCLTSVRLRSGFPTTPRITALRFAPCRQALCSVPFCSLCLPPGALFFAPLSHATCTLRLRKCRAFATLCQLKYSVHVTSLLSKRIKAHTTKNAIARCNVCHYFFCGLCFCHSSLSYTKTGLPCTMKQCPANPFLCMLLTCLFYGAYN